MAYSLGLQSAILYLFSIYYKIFKKVDYNDGAARRGMIIESQPENGQANNVLNGDMSSTERTALDEFQITSLIKRERYSRDSRQWQKLRNCYHPDPSKTRIEVAAFKGNIDGFMNVSQMTTPPGLKILHPTDPVDFEIRGSKALAWSLDRTIARFDHNGVEYELTTWWRTVSRLEKTEDAGWKICMWETVYNRDQIVSVDPQVAATGLENLDRFRKSYKHFAWFISLKGVRMPDNLPGDDLPDSVAEVVKKSRAWLDSEECL